MNDNREAIAALRIASTDERSAVEFIEARRWAGAPTCPWCACTNVYKMASATGGRERHFRWRCRGCKKMFSVRTGTVMEESRLPLRVWVHAFWRACASKKGISALQLSREAAIDYKSALFLLNRIRAAMSDWNGPAAPKLTGTVEVDETYVGGKPRPGTPRKMGAGPMGTDKAPVFAMVEREGDLRMVPVHHVSAVTLRPIIAANIDLSSRLMSDDSTVYRGISKDFTERGHHVVRHSRKEYAAPNGVHSNTVESAFSLLKRGIIGTYHSVSRKHLGRYCDEFAFRWNHRYVTDDVRADAAILKCAGKRLTRAQVLAGQEAAWKAPSRASS